MSYIDDIVEIYEKEENNFINRASLETVKTSALYMFYHYYNADVTKLDELNQTFCFLNGDIGEIIAICNDLYDDEVLDFITVLPGSIMNEMNLDSNNFFLNYLEKINLNVAEIICRKFTGKNEEAIKRFDELDGYKMKSYSVILLCNCKREIKEKIWYQQVANEFKVINNSIRFKMYFEDDILEEVSDIEEPKDSVSTGTIRLFGKSIVEFGQEKSFIGFISAFSLKENYFLYSTSGLFASNLRYYVKNLKIDSQITNTIMNEPENFCYYNNGVIITCDDYEIVDNEVRLINFSIVNGGQTSNLIGRTDFQIDFPVMCKVIKNKYGDLEKKVDFLSKVAEASNTQKPIKAKDLIANRKEQRLLKIQFEHEGIFLQVKRGERIVKGKYSENWQNATNDNVAQMLNSLVYQSPGTSKNAKSKLLEDDKNYYKLFGPTYSSKLFVSLQHTKVNYNNWVKRLKKSERFGNVKLGLSKNSDLMILGVLGLIYKLISNKGLANSIKRMPNGSFDWENEDLKYLISQNDIGLLNLYSENLLLGINKNDYFTIFNIIFDKILIPAYDQFKKEYPTYSYSNFVKSDMYYYNFVVSKVCELLVKNEQIFNYADIFDLSVESKATLSVDTILDEHKPGLEQELLVFRMRKHKELNIKTYEVLKNNQMVALMKYKPSSFSDLKRDCKFSDAQCHKFGEAIIKIISKYSIDNYIK